MQLVWVSAAAWLVGLAVFRTAAMLSADPTFKGPLLPLALAALMVTVGAVAAFFAPLMFLMRGRTARSRWWLYVLAGALAGLLPGVFVGLVAGYIARVDRSAVSTVATLLSAPGAGAVAAGVCSGAVFGAGFFRAFVRHAQVS